MLYWTPLELERVFDGYASQTVDVVDVEYNGVWLQAEALGDGKAKILRLLSTEPSDFLRSELQPGTVIHVI